MICTSDHRYNVTRKKAEGFRKALAWCEKHNPSRTHIDPLLLKAEREGMESLLGDLELQMAEYEQLKTADEPVVRVRDFGEIGEGLMAARVGKGWSPKELAKHTDLTEQEIRHYEKRCYEKANFQVLLGVAYALGVQVEMTLTVPRQEAPVVDPADLLKPAAKASAAPEPPTPRAAEG